MCVFRTQSRYSLNRHRWASHKVGLRTLGPNRIDVGRRKVIRFRSSPRTTVTFACNRCGLDTSDPNEWGRHINQHAKEQIKLLQERSPRALNRKKESSQNTAGDNIFNCSECDFTCRRKDMYTAHVKQHSKKAIVSKCDECPYTTSNPYNLMKHKRTHTGEKPFNCSFCSYRSADSGNLNKHINSHHGAEGVQKRAMILMKKKAVKKPAPAPSEAVPKPVKVPAAAAATPRQQTVKVVKLAEAPTSSAKQTTAMLFKCTECEYQCANEEFLIAHLSIHKKQGDQYVCAICDYSSRNQQNLAKHIRTHTGEKPYQCRQCSYCAADKGNLNKHIKTHHKNENAEKMEKTLSSTGCQPTAPPHQTGHPVQSTGY